MKKILVNSSQNSNSKIQIMQPQQIKNQKNKKDEQFSKQKPTFQPLLKQKNDQNNPPLPLLTSFKKQILNIDKNLQEYKQLIEIKEEELKFLMQLDSSESSKSINEKLFDDQAKKLNILQIKAQNLIRQKEERDSQIYLDFENKLENLKKYYNVISEQYQNFQIEKQTKIEDYNQYLEIKTLQKEDLNGKLIQRAELVGLKEEFESVFDHLIINLKNELLDEEIGLIKKQKEFNTNYNQIKQSKENLVFKLEKQQKQNSDYLIQIDSIKDQQRKIQKELNQNLQILIDSQQKNENYINQEAIKYQLKDLESICSQFMKMASDCPDINQFWNFVYINYIKDKSPCDQVKIYKQNFYQYFESQIQQEDLRQQSGSQIQIMDQELIQLNNEITEKNELIEQINSQLKLQEEQIVIFQKLEQEIEDEQKKIETKRNTFIIQKTDIAFNEYLINQKEVFKNIQEVHGIQVLEKLKIESHQQFFDIISNEYMEQIEKIGQVYEKLFHYESAILINIQVVDSEILPGLRDSVRMIEESHGYLQQTEEIDQQYQVEKLKIEQSINEFKSQLEEELRNNSIDSELKNVENAIIACKNSFNQYQQSTKQSQLIQNPIKQNDDKQYNTLKIQQLQSEIKDLKGEMERLQIRKFTQNDNSRNMIYNSLSEALSKKNQSKELGAKYFMENNKKIQ